ncbi:hypothetical protein AZH53_03100 [Methanomicrobiaceae archaeon CYW5]|nr:hypothetical protein [Methanovulcanius yangii]
MEFIRLQKEFNVQIDLHTSIHRAEMISDIHYAFPFSKIHLPQFQGISNGYFYIDGSPEDHGHQDMVELETHDKLSACIFDEFLKRYKNDSESITQLMADIEVVANYLRIAKRKSTDNSRDSEHH